MRCKKLIISILQAKLFKFMKSNFTILLFVFSIFTNLKANLLEPPLIEIRTGQALISMDYSPDGSKIVVGGQNNDVVIWDITSGSVVKTMKGHSDDVVTVRYSPNGRYIASGGVDNKFLIWDAITGDLLHTIAAHKDYVRDVAFSPDSKMVATASWDGTAKVWQTLTGDLVTTITAHKDNVTAVSFSSDGAKLATGSGDKTIKLWNTTTWLEISSLLGHTDEVWDVDFSNNGKYLAGGAWDNKARVWDVVMQKEIFTFAAHTSDTWSVSFSPDDQLLATGGGDKKVRVWDLATGELAADVSGTYFGGEVETVCFSPDGKKIAAASRDGYIRIFKTPTTGERRATYVNKKSEVWKVRGEFEKTGEYERRLQNAPFQEITFVEEYNNKAIAFFEKSTKWSDFTLKGYQPDREVYQLESPILGTLFMRIPPKEAEMFKNNFKNIVVKKPKFLVGTENLFLEYVDIELMVGKELKKYLLLSEYFYNQK